MARRQGTCGLCGAQAEVTREHFVPRGLWSGALPVKVETVSACDECNAGSNLDDEHFRNTLVMMFDQDHPEKRRLFQGPVLRSFERHRGWVTHALKNLTVRPLLSPSGLWLGDYPTFPLDIDRFDRSLTKIVKGLFFTIRKTPFPKDGQIGLVGVLNSETKPLIDLIETKLFPPTFDFGDDVFEWRFSQTRDGMTFWKLAFYRSVVFYALGFENAEVWEEVLAGVQERADALR